MEKNRGGRKKSEDEGKKPDAYFRRTSWVLGKNEEGGRNQCGKGSWKGTEKWGREK
jgi:hypothetical protein